MMIRRCEMEVRADAQMAYTAARQRTGASLTALRNLLARLALMSGPKTLVLLSEGLFVDPREPSDRPAGRRRRGGGRHDDLRRSASTGSTWTRR